MMERKISILDKIGSLIPGYAGYADRDSRRNCDKIIRDKIATYILNCEATLNDKMNIEIKNKNFIILDEIEQCRKKLNTLSEKIKYFDSFRLIFSFFIIFNLYSEIIFLLNFIF